MLCRIEWDTTAYIDRHHYFWQKVTPHSYSGKVNNQFSFVSTSLPDMHCTAALTVNSSDSHVLLTKQTVNSEQGSKHKVLESFWVHRVIPQQHSSGPYPDTSHPTHAIHRIPGSTTARLGTSPLPRQRLVPDPPLILRPGFWCNCKLPVDCNRFVSDVLPTLAAVFLASPLTALVCRWVPCRFLPSTFMLGQLFALVCRCSLTL